MASLTNIRNEIGNNLSSITGLNVYKYVPDMVEPPTAVVGVVERIEYDSTMARGSDVYTIPVLVYISRIDAQLSQESLDSYLQSSGANSIKAQIESDTTLNSEAQSVRVTDATDYGVYNVNNIDYIGVQFSVEVIA
jgi:hypothetical protein